MTNCTDVNSSVNVRKKIMRRTEISRVMKPGNKFMNTTKYPPRVTNPSKVKRIKGENPNPSKAKSLTDWLFLKYDMSYNTYRNKSKKRRDELRQEYESETGNKITLRNNKDDDYDDMLPKGSDTDYWMSYME
jgi:hypothetical protein